MKKEEIRKIYLKKRSDLQENKRELDQKILGNFLTRFSLSGELLIHIYIPIEKFQEIDTHIFIEEFRKRSFRICVPKIVEDEIKSIEVNKSTEWIQNNWGIKEPVDGREIDPGEIDMVIIPLLAYDINGYRVGYGKGFYDRFLPACGENVLKVGLSYFPPLDKIDDLEPDDVPLNFCVSPDNIYEF